MKNRVRRTGWHTRFTVDAILRIDIQHPSTLVKTIGRTNDDAVGVPAVTAWLSNNVSHGIVALEVFAADTFQCNHCAVNSIKSGGAHNSFSRRLLRWILSQTLFASESPYLVVPNALAVPLLVDSYGNCWPEPHKMRVISGKLPQKALV